MSRATMPNRETVAACPFCGGAAEVTELDHCGKVHTINVSCESCSLVMFGGNESREQMVAKWSRRTGAQYRVSGRVGRLVDIANGQARLDLGNGVACWCPVEDLEAVEP